MYVCNMTLLVLLKKGIIVSPRMHYDIRRSCIKKQKCREKALDGHNESFLTGQAIEMWDSDVPAVKWTISPTSMW